MALITITSDFGTNSVSLAALKGCLLSANDEITQLVDISNEIKEFDIVEAAFVFKNTYCFYPPGTINIIAVNPFYNRQYKLLVLEQEGQFFIAPNNGILPLIFDQGISGEICEIKDYSNTVEIFHAISKLVQELSSGKEVKDLGPSPEHIYQKIALQAVVTKDTIRGTIIYVDRFGNLITNISKEQFEKIRNNRSFSVFFRHKDPITSVHEHYHQVPVGDELCLFRLDKYLEIAINMGNASKNLGIKLEDTIQIDFHDK